MLKVVSIQTVKSKLKRSVKAESRTNSFLGDSDITVTFGPDRGRGIDITKNLNFRF